MTRQESTYTLIHDALGIPESEYDMNITIGGIQGFLNGPLSGNAFNKFLLSAQPARINEAAWEAYRLGVFMGYYYGKTEPRK